MGNDTLFMVLFTNDFIMSNIGFISLKHATFEPFISVDRTYKTDGEVNHQTNNNITLHS